MTCKAPGGKDRGAALVTALMVVAFMAAVSVSLVEMMRHTLQRTSVFQDRVQAGAYLDGAQAYGEVLLARFAGDGTSAFTPEGPWDGQVRVFPVEGGQLAARIRDQNNCLNINALHAGGEGGSDDAAAERLRALAAALDVPQAETEDLIAQAADWIDADRSARPGGAEDDAYLNRSMAHRAANQPFVELAELRLLPVMTPALYQRLAPYLCVLPASLQPPLNVNTLQPDQSVLITALTGGAVSLQAADQVLFRRPSTGFASVEAFWADPAFAEIGEDDRPAGAIALRSEWFELELSVELADVRLVRVQTVRMDRTGGFARLPPVQGAVL